jgi:hypothetical protein
LIFADDYELIAWGISKTNLVSSASEEAFSVPPCAFAICDAM